MNLTQKLLGYLNRVFDKGPDRVLVLRFRYDGTAMSWRISDGLLTTTVAGGTGGPLSIRLETISVASLAALIAAQPGYTVEFTDTTAIPGLMATVLIDGSGNQDQSNGDHLYAYTSVLWAYLEAQASELRLLRLAIDEALAQMAANTASGEWVDEHGSFYVVPRANDESDAAYAARIVAEVGQARGTNVAISDGVRRASGADGVVVEDYSTFTVAGDGTKSFGLFDVTATIDVNAPLTPAEIDANTRAIIEAMRDAGTHLRTLRYIRTCPLLLHAGAAAFSGHDVTVSFSVLSLDGSWILDGSEDLDGVRGA